MIPKAVGHLESANLEGGLHGASESSLVRGWGAF